MVLWVVSGGLGWFADVCGGLRYFDGAEKSRFAANRIVTKRMAPEQKRKHLNLMATELSER